MFGPTRVRIPALLERWQSGRLYLTRNQAMSYGIRGFESLPLRQYLTTKPCFFRALSFLCFVGMPFGVPLDVGFKWLALDLVGRQSILDGANGESQVRTSSQQPD